MNSVFTNTIQNVFPTGEKNLKSKGVVGVSVIPMLRRQRGQIPEACCLESKGRQGGQYPGKAALGCCAG